MVTTRAPFEHLTVCHPLAGVRDPWDAAAVVERPPDLIVALVDAVGQGDGARQAVERARAAALPALGSSVAEVFRAVHQAAAGSQGVSLGVARLSPARGLLEFTGIGRVYGVVAGPVERVFASDPGTLGVGLQRAPSTTRFRYSAGDLVALAADGQVDAWDLRPLWSGRSTPLEDLARRLDAASGRAPEDASLVLARAW